MAAQVPNIFVEQYDQGQKKIRADLMDENFAYVCTQLDTNSDAADAAQAAADAAQAAADAAQITADGKATAAQAAHAAAPSGSVISLSVPANGGTVTAPADGYITIRAISSSSIGAGVVRLQNLSGAYAQACFAPTNGGLAASLMVSSGDSVTILYSSCTDVVLYFCYANGSAPTV